MLVRSRLGPFAVLFCACASDGVETGPAPPWSGHPQDSVCAPATIAEPSPGSCVEGATCIPLGEDDPCLEGREPICGCDGVTYPDDCARRRAGITRDHSGSCGSGDPCSAASPCPDPAEYCETPQGACEDAGTCVLPIPDVCAGRPAPECGCDGESFQNECLRRAAGVPLAHAGECEGDPGECVLVAPTGCCFEDADCASGICLGTCATGEARTCVEPPIEGRCWDASDCGSGEQCVGAIPCACGWPCDFPPTAGTCQLDDEGGL